MIRASLGALSIAVALGGCGGDDEVTQFDMLYQVRCDVAGGCAAIPPRDINALSGTGGLNLNCDLTESGGLQTMQLTAKAADNSYGIEMRNATFPAGGGAITPGCRVTVYEDGNRYESDCTSAQPSGDCLTERGCDAACRLFNVAVTGADVTMNFYCQGLYSPALGHRNSRELTAPGGGFSGLEAPEHPATFTIMNCGVSD